MNQHRHDPDTVVDSETAASARCAALLVVDHVHTTRRSVVPAAMVADSSPDDIFLVETKRSACRSACSTPGDDVIVALHWMVDVHNVYYITS